ncbi:MAG: LCP family protein [Clostridia bacterium]|nr:LCP family protein [Clostridia bacterium]
MKGTDTKKRTWLYAAIGVAAVLAIALGVLLGGKISGVLFSGEDLFTEVTEPTMTPLPLDVSAAPGEEEATPVPTGEEPVTPAPTEDPYAAVEKVADKDMMKGIVNILFIGVDYEQARVEKGWSGKGGNAFHSDVMLVCAVNFNENRVDLISLPRDTYASIPGVKGIYKLNASLNCGTDGKNYGIYCEDGQGFEKVCEAAEWMLGGIDVDYYYAVTMESVKQIVDIVGGVWYNLEGDFDNGGRYYKAGYQFMNGQACLDYMRVRKAGHGQLPTGDDDRVNRQKRMMVAIFKKMQEENLVLKVPELLAAFDGSLFTNCNMSQTAALALFGSKLNPDNIGAYSMSGSGATLFHWNFLFTDQSNRVNIIKKIYGVDVSTYPKYSEAYGRYEWCKMLQDQYMEICDPLKTYVQKLIDEDDKLPETLEESPAPTDTPPAEETPAPNTPETTPQSTPESTPAPTAAPTELPATPTPAPQEQEGAVPGRTIRYLKGVEGTRQYSKEERDLFEKYKAALSELKSQYSTADKEAKKAASRKSNSLKSVSTSLLAQMIEVQDLAVSVAKTFGYDKVPNIAITNYPNETYHSKSPWGLNFWDNKKINAIDVNFN